MIRAFIAVEIDPPNKQKLSELISSLKKSNTEVKWVTEKQMHFTLKFLGNIEENKVQRISDALKSIADNFNAFNINLSEIGAFPDMQRPRVIWVGVGPGKDALELLVREIEAALKKIGFHSSAELRTEKEKSKFKAHLTLGRVKALKNIGKLEKIINEIGFRQGNKIKIDKITLFKSTLTPKGAIHTSLNSANLIL